MSGDKEFSEIVKKCKVLLLDIEGTTTSISFVKDKLFPYAEENVKKFLDDQWETDSVKEVIVALRKLSVDDKENSVEGVVEIPGEDATKEDQIDGVVKSVKWMMSSDRKAGPLKQLQGLIWERGYDQGDINGHVYDDVSAALEHWHSVDGQKIYIYSSGSVQAQKLLFGRSLAGDLLKHIDGHFDTAVGGKQEKGSYVKIVEQIGCKADEILFLTDIEKEAQAAREAGLHTALVTRDGNAPLSEEATSAYPILTNFSQLTANLKRKQETKDEQPAKIARTDTQDEVKIDIEEPPMETGKEETKEDKPPVVEETVVEEITDSNEVVEVAEIDIEPVVIEEKQAGAEEKEVQDQEMKEEEKSEEVKTEEKIDEETIVTVTELKEGEKVNDEITMEPIVEEPNVEAEMVELHNVGEELEKECDEILSKVQNVTNLDNIAGKPILDSIPEDNMDTANSDTNDIVDDILNTELDMENEKKQAEANTEKDDKSIHSESSTEKDEKSNQSESSTEKDDTSNQPEPSNEKDTDKLANIPEKPEIVPEHTNGNGTDKPEIKLNGNGNAIANGNGDSNDSDSRLEDVQNGAIETNGKEVGQGDCKEVTDIKVKTVAEEVQAEPVEGTVET